MNGELGIGVLAAMITPAVLISASGTLILSTSNRLARAADRVRRFSERMRALSGDAAEKDAFALSEKKMIVAQLPKLMRRVRIIHRALITFYMAVGLFVLTSLVLGASRVAGFGGEPVAVIIGLGGAVVLFLGAAMLTLEAQLSLDVNLAEMEFLREQGALR